MLEDNNNDKALTEIKNKKLKKALKKIIEIINKKWLLKTSTTFLLIAIIIAIYIGVTVLLDKITLPEIDCTSTKLYSLSEETKTKVKALDNDITITLINFSDNESLQSIVEKYKRLNKKINVVQVDNLVERADLMTKYSLSTDSSLIVIESGEKETTLNSYDLFTYDYSTYEQIDITEEALTNAIVDVTNEHKNKLYFINNHNAFQSNAFAKLEKTLKDDANEVEYIDLLTTGKVPDDCDLLVITTLKEDITQIERDNIMDYINRGGKILFLCGETSYNTNLENFNQVLNVYGISLDGGTIFEGKKENMLSGYPDIIVEEMTSNSITKNMNMKLKASLIDATPIIIDEEKLEELNVEYETLLNTSSSAFVRTNLNINSIERTSEDSEKGVFNVGVLASKKINDEITSKMIIYSNAMFATDMTIELGQYPYSLINLYNNQDIIANSVLYLNEKQDIITIRKNYDVVKFTTTQSQEAIVKTIIFSTPIIIIIIGITVWILRKRKQ